MKKRDSFVTKDSGKRVLYKSGFNRDTTEGKPRYDLIPTEMLTRLAGLYARGAEKYGDSNWQLADTPEELQRFKQSAWRHFIAWLEGDIDEDHASAVSWNVFAYEWHINNKKKSK
mgnify:CR=1 FL=1